MASNPFLFFPMEPGGSSSTAVGRDPGQPFLQQTAVLYVPPLRIVAPPGVPPFLPHSFDPLTVFNGLHPELFAPQPSTTYGDQFNTPSSSGFDHPRGASGFDNFPSSAVGCGDRYGNGNYASHSNQGHDNFGNNGDQVHESPNAKQKAKQKGKQRSAAPENGNPAFNYNTQMSGGKPGKAKASAVRDFPFGCFKNTGAPDSHAEVSKNSPSNEHSVDEIPASTTNKRGREYKVKRSAATKRPATDGFSSAHIPPHRAVINILRLYDALRRSLMLEEERKNIDANKGGRPDLNAGSVINARSLAVNRTQKVVGPVPGIEVGDQFYFRMEICCVGLHGPIQAGIEYITAKESEHKTPVAISIISSGGYDAKDDGEELVYTGQGGKSALDSKPIEDQKLERGNLAMEGSMKHRVPVRVTRGIKDSASPSGKAYTYDGLYMVEECWTEKGKFGFEEFRFRLRRCPGQPELGSTLLKLSNTLKYKPGEREGLRLPDIANGKEGLPVCVVNSVDSVQCPPPFDYSTSLHYPHEVSYYQQFGRAQGCDCEGVCSPSQACSCFVENKSVFAYLSDGILVRERGVIYECGSNCRCSFGCKNRLSQRALKFRLEVFKTEDRGWGLRSWDTIPAGSFICEYTGKLVQKASSLQTRDFALDLRRLPKSNPCWGDVSRFLDNHAAQVASSIPRPDLIIDSSQTGNAARFINHCCSPNVLVQCVFRDHQDTKRPHIMLFAMDNIPPFRELTIDYGSDLPTSDYQVPGKQCLCKSKECKGTFYQ